MLNLKLYYRAIGTNTAQYSHKIGVIAIEKNTQNQEINSNYYRYLTFHEDAKNKYCKKKMTFLNKWFEEN